MKLWLLSQNVNQSYNVFSAAVVAAQTRQEAIMIHPDKNKKEWDGVIGERRLDYGTWCEAQYVQVKLIGSGRADTSKGVIIASYRTEYPPEDEDCKLGLCSHPHPYPHPYDIPNPDSVEGQINIIVHGTTSRDDYHDEWQATCYYCGLTRGLIDSSRDNDLKKFETLMSNAHIYDNCWPNKKRCVYCERVKNLMAFFKENRLFQKQEIKRK